MRKLILLLLLSTAMCQTKAPVTLKVTASSVDLVNDSSKEILFVSLRVSTGFGTSFLQTHDFYFTRALAPSNVAMVVHDDPDSEPYVKAEMLYIQFVDGSDWGNVNANDHAPLVIASRKSRLAFLNRMLAAFNSGGDNNLANALTNETDQPSAARFFKAMLSQGGSAPVITRIKDDIANAKSRAF